MIPAEVLEQQLAAYLSGMRRDRPDVERALAHVQRVAAAEPADAARLRSEIGPWRRLFVLEEVDEARYLSAVKPL
jgi:hypothetical protein